MTSEQVASTLAEAQAHADAGGYAAGFIAYEAAPAFDPAMTTYPPPEHLPLVWFGLYDHPVPHAAPPEPDGSREPWDTPWQADLPPTIHAALITTIKELIASGETYQVNLTFPAWNAASPDPWTLFQALCWPSAEPGATFITTDRHSIACASPELFFEQAGDGVTTRPMKGTRPRGLWPGDDAATAAELRASAKDRAENVMIVDLLRNDLGRVARTGSVRVPHLFEVAPHRGVLQMTSTVTARTDRSPTEVLSALFPCGSVTGAPKMSTMRIIRNLETGPRGVYCGAVGWLGPNRTARFCVPIRTAQFDHATGRARYDVGSGITWDSDPAREHEECLAKLAPVRNPLPRFRLLETLRWEPAAGFHQSAEHIQRLLASARYFGWMEITAPDVAAALNAAASEWPTGNGPRRVRMTVGRRGDVQVESQPLARLPEPRIVRLARKPVQANDVFLYHKTTCRRVYEDALEGLTGADDAILWNEKGEVTETTIANIILEDEDGAWWTPPVRSGLLAGVARNQLLLEGRVRERVVKTEELVGFRRLLLVNSVRGVMEAKLLAD